MLLALDLDGTTLDDTGTLRTEVLETLERAKRAGHKLCFVTGRRDIDMLPVREHLKTVEYILLNNGGKLVRTSDEVVLKNDLVSSSDAECLIRHCLKSDYQLHILSDGYWGVNKYTPGLALYIEQLGTEPFWYNSLDGIPMGKIEGFMATADQEPVCRFISSKNLNFDFVRSDAESVDIFRKGISKWKGLQMLLDYLCMTSRDVIAVGDYENDIEILKNVGIGVAVANALPQVQEVADYITVHDNNHNAVGDVVEELLLKNKKGLCLPTKAEDEN